MSTKLANRKTAYEGGIGLPLAEQPFLKGIEPRFIAELADCAFTTQFEADTYICKEGDPADRFYILRGGQVALEVHTVGGQTRTIQTLYEWEALGWSWLFAPYRWHFDVRTLTPVEAIAFDARCLRNKCEQNHDLGYELMRRFAQVLIERLQATRFQMMDVYRPGT
jgi:CRP/FNR family cyclic AMP-dependent transcriptional regulator